MRNAAPVCSCPCRCPELPDDFVTDVDDAAGTSPRGISR
jgi:hypothetical protein